MRSGSLVLDEQPHDDGVRDERLRPVSRVRGDRANDWRRLAHARVLSICLPKNESDWNVSSYGLLSNVVWHRPPERTTRGNYRPLSGWMSVKLMRNCSASLLSPTDGVVILGTIDGAFRNYMRSTQSKQRKFQELVQADNSSLSSRRPKYTDRPGRIYQAPDRV